MENNQQRKITSGFKNKILHSIDTLSDWNKTLNDNF